MAKNKPDFVDGTTKKPEENATRIGQWEWYNNMVVFWLLHLVVNEIAESVVYCRTTSEI